MTDVIPRPPWNNKRCDLCFRRAGTDPIPFGISLMETRLLKIHIQFDMQWVTAVLKLNGRFVQTRDWKHPKFYCVRAKKKKKIIILHAQEHPGGNANI